MTDTPRSRPDDPTIAHKMPEKKADGTTHPGAEQETLPPSDTAPRPDGMEAMPERFGRYRIVRELGHGAMGSVYLAEDTELHRQVALKIPKFAQQDEPELLERFYREARAAATLNHPNICQVYDIGEQHGMRYITMAYIGGPALSELVGTPKLRSERTIAKLVRKIAIGLAEAHSKGILHRDLKPSNILLDERNEPVITDFGLARQVEQDAESRLTQDGALLGTPAYMSPEQVGGDREQIGPASDVYSLGVILYELLTGKVPYKGPIVAVIGQILQGQPKPPSQLRSGLDKRLEAVCMKMMASSVNERYSSARDAAAALAHYPEQKAPQTQAAASQAAGTHPSLEEHKQSTIGLLREGKFSEAAVRLQKLANVRGVGAEPYARWARAELAWLKELPKEAREKGQGLVTGAIKSLARQDYARVIELLQAIPEEYCPPEAVVVLTQAQELKQETDQLNERMKQAVRDRQYDGLRENVLERLLELEPGNLTARDIFEHLGTYRPGEPLRFDAAGTLLTADVETLRLDPSDGMAHDGAQPQPVRPVKAGARQKGKPAPAGKARSEMPVVPIAIGLGVGGGSLIVLIIILVISFGSSGGPDTTQQSYVPPDSIAQAPEKPRAEPPQEQAVEPTEPKVEHVEPKPASAKATEKPAERPSEPDEKTTTQPQAKQEEEKKQRKKKVGGKTGKPAPTPAVRKTPTEAVKTKPKPAPAATLSKEQQLSRMFAEIKRISLAIPPETTDTNGQSNKPDPRGTLDYRLRAIVQSQFAVVARRLGLSVAQTDDAVLDVKWDLEEEGDFFVATMSGDLKCRAADSEPYSVWTHQQEIIRLKRGTRVNVENLINDGVEEFFKPFQRDYRTAGK